MKDEHLHEERAEEQHDTTEEHTESLQEQIDRLQDQLLRAQADFVNYKDRAARERADFAAFAQEGFVSQLLPTIDALDQAMQHIPEDIANLDWTKGMQTIVSMFTNTLEQMGLTKIAIEEESTAFDPTLHEAIGQEVREGKSGMILKVWQSGYMLKGTKVIRPAKVTVGE